MNKKNSSSGFTIVELLIVIVVIGILASVSIVAYSGIQDRARRSVASAELNQIAKKLEIYYIQNRAYPATLTQVQIENSDTASYVYSSNNSTNPKTYTLTVAVGSRSLFISSQNTTPQEVAALTGSTAIEASDEKPPDETKDKLVDNDITSKWLTLRTTGWVLFSATSQVSVDSYVVSSANDAADRDPRNWTLYGSNDRSSWTTLDSRNGQTFSGRRQSNTYSIGSQPPYGHYKFEITQNNGSNYLQVADLTLYASGTAVPIIR